ncbi:MAG TPA: hypothetical protein VGK73_16135 [Polyangiaceae bacterium]
MTVEVRTFVTISFSGWGAQAEVVFYGSDGRFLPVTDDYPKPSDFLDEDPPPSTERLP